MGLGRTDAQNFVGRDGHAYAGAAYQHAEALLPEDYISDVGVRLSLYKRLASAFGPDEVSDLAIEIEDRFGPPPAEARRLVHLMRLKTELRKLHALGCEASSRGRRGIPPLDGAKPPIGRQLALKFPTSSADEHAEARRGLTDYPFEDSEAKPNANSRRR